MSSHNIYTIREWMYKRLDENTGDMRLEFKEGLKEFMRFASNQEMTRKEGIMACPCVLCANEHFLTEEIVWNHLYWGGFTPGYYIWLSHGEDFRSGPSNRGDDRGDDRRDDRGYDRLVEENVILGDERNREEENVVRMGREGMEERIDSTYVPEEPNIEARSFFEMLDAAKQPIYPGCKEGHSPLSAATRMMNIKTDYNLSEDCVDAWADLFHDYLPEDNLAPDSYNAIQKLVAGLGLPYQMIDVCKENCMIFWRETANLTQCRFCGAERFQVTTGRTKIPFKRMWYLPLADRLKRLYQSERTAATMRWHAEHAFIGDISHPSDAAA